MSEVVVHVRYFNVLADYAGTKRAQVRVPVGTTVRDFMKHLSEINPEPFRHALMRGDAFNSYLRVFRNNQLVAGEGFDKPIADGDEILLFPAIAGGSNG